jgi:hypothetical protein
MKRLLLILVILYIGGYLVFRSTNAEVWAKDNQTYVTFQNSIIGKSAYFLWRPLSYVDAMLFGMRFHIGPHQEQST